jgi:hypothetical protein
MDTQPRLMDSERDRGPGVFSLNGQLQGWLASKVGGSASLKV